MKHGYIKGMISGICISIFCAGLMGSAFAYQKQTVLNYPGIKITLNGSPVIPTDAEGNTVEPFTIDGTTYLPVRGIASALGLDVVWDQSTQTVVLTNAVPSASASFTLGPGEYVVGRDLPAGTYNCIAVSGFGVLRGDIASCGPAGFVQTMGSASASIDGTSASVQGSQLYNNLSLVDKDIIYIEMNLTVKFEQAT